MSTNAQTSSDAPAEIDSILRQAFASRASDIHWEPTATGYSIRLRVDAMLQEVRSCDAAAGRAMVNRLMVLSQLLTYRLDVPQEGRFTFTSSQAPATRPIDLRVAIIPTIHGIRAVVRLPGELVAPRDLDYLNFHPTILTQLKAFAASDFGMLICCGPAGSGKTTTLYSLLRHMVQIAPHQSIITLEDPVERAVEGVTQIEVSPFGQLTYEKALRSILRQDPQVLMLGEIRDPATAALAIQAALTGHRLLCTLHAPSAAGAIARLTEMGIEPYQLAATLAGVLSLRLVRRTTNPGIYAGRVPLAEWTSLHSPLRRAILNRQGPDELSQAIASQPGHFSMAACAQWLTEQTLTDSAELSRVGY
jgi:type II secretory ATPase GspE/PulE/Tfp pilus assembly ATPase PilB-like protein